MARERGEEIYQLKNELDELKRNFHYMKNEREVEKMKAQGE